MQHCFPVVKIESSQSSVVSANGLRDGGGGRGHRRVTGVRPRRLARTHGLIDSIMITPSDLVDWFTAHNGTFDRSALKFAQTDTLGRAAFALRDLQVPPPSFFFFLASAGNTVNSSRSNRSKATPFSPYLAISRSRRAPPLSAL